MQLSLGCHRRTGQRLLRLLLPRHNRRHRLLLLALLLLVCLLQLRLPRLLLLLRLRPLRACARIHCGRLALGRLCRRALGRLLLALLLLETRVVCPLEPKILVLLGAVPLKVRLCDGCAGARGAAARGHAQPAWAAQGLP